MKLRTLLIALLFMFSLVPVANAAEGNILVTCGFDHAAKDDPIVFPGLPGASHLHSFLGVLGINAFTMTADVAAEPSTCQVTGESTAMWTPAIIQPNGTVINPISVGVYYRNPDPTKPIQPFPAGFRFVQGNSHNLLPSGAAATFRCRNQNGVTSIYIPASCPVGGDTNLDESIYTPQCWDGVSINPPDHHPLVACTGTNIRLPAIQFIIHWPASAVGGKLSSDIDAGALPGLTAHIDYWFGADPTYFSKIVGRCMNAGIQCRISAGAVGPAGSIYDNGTKTTVLSAAEANPPVF